MRLLAQYRRNSHPNSGFAEKLAFQLSKGPATSTQLAALFGISPSEVNQQISCIRHKSGKTMQVEIIAEEKLTGTTMQRTYALAGKPKRIVSRGRKPFIINKSRDRSPESYAAAVAAAKRRERLIKAGHWPLLDVAGKEC